MCAGRHKISYRKFIQDHIKSELTNVNIPVSIFKNSDPDTISTWIEQSWYHDIWRCDQGQVLSYRDPLTFAVYVIDTDLTNIPWEYVEHYHKQNYLIIYHSGEIDHSNELRSDVILSHHTTTKKFTRSTLT